MTSIIPRIDRIKIDIGGQTFVDMDSEQLQIFTDTLTTKKYTKITNLCSNEYPISVYNLNIILFFDNIDETFFILQLDIFHICKPGDILQNTYNIFDPCTLNHVSENLYSVELLQTHGFMEDIFLNCVVDSASIIVARPNKARLTIPLLVTANKYGCKLTASRIEIAVFERTNIELISGMERINGYIKRISTIQVSDYCILHKFRY